MSSKLYRAYFIGGVADKQAIDLKDEYALFPPDKIRWYDGSSYIRDVKSSRRREHVYRLAEEQKV